MLRDPSDHEMWRCPVCGEQHDLDDMFQTPHLYVRCPWVRAFRHVDPFPSDNVRSRRTVEELTKKRRMDALLGRQLLDLLLGRKR